MRVAATHFSASRKALRPWRLRHRCCSATLFSLMGRTFPAAQYWSALVGLTNRFGVVRILNARTVFLRASCLELLHSPCATRLKSGWVAASSAASAVTAGAFLAQRGWHRGVTSVPSGFTECETGAAWAIGSHGADQSLAAHFWIFRGFFPNLEKTFPTTRAFMGKIQDRSTRGLVEQPAKDNQRRAIGILIAC